MPEADNGLENLVEQVQRGEKYRQISPEYGADIRCQRIGKKEEL